MAVDNRHQFELHFMRARSVSEVVPITAASRADVIRHARLIANRHPIEIRQFGKIVARVGRNLSGCVQDMFGQSAKLLTAR